MSNTIENVLILQGGGSLGSFGCGVFKALAKNNIKIDIIAGTSIGGLNAAVIAGGKEDHPEKALEQFWLELGEGSSNKNLLNFNLPFEGPLIESEFPVSTTTTTTTDSSSDTSSGHSSIPRASQLKSLISFYKAAAYGNEKVFMPRWRPEYAPVDPEYFTPNKWTYLYDHSPLIETLEKYVDYNRLQPEGKPNARLIITAVNILTSEPLIFDSSKQQITSKHILATTGYPRYYFKWVEEEVP